MENVNIKVSDYADSKGKVIIEGDIIENDGVQYEVVFNDGHFFARNLSEEIELGLLADIPCLRIVENIYLDEDER